MGTVLEECTTEEQRSVVRILWAKWLNAKGIHKERFPVYGGKCLSRKEFNWVYKFSQGHSKIAADDAQVFMFKLRQKQLQRAEELIRADRRITIDSVATAPGCSHGLAYSITHDCLKFQKVCALWVQEK
jgi:hypothetical protein